MSDVFKFVKKIFTLGVVSTTMLWSVGASFLATGVATAVTCPALSAGDMVKVVGKPAIYAVNNQSQVMYFPDGDVFKSWRPTYGGYISMTQDCFIQLQTPTTYPGAINYKPGSYVVKRAVTDQLYVVEPNNTLATITPEAATALYGVGYKKMIVDDRDWPNYVNKTATPVTEAKPHVGMLVSNAGKTYYVDAGAVLREVSATGMTANGFQTKFVHAVADSAITGYTTGALVDAEVKALTDKSQSGGVVVVSPTPTPTSTPVAGNLTIALAADNPAAGYLATGTSFNKMLKVTLTAGSGTIKVTSLRFRKGGFFANTQIAGLDVVDSKGVRHGNVISTLTAENDALVTMTSNPIVVTAGTPETVTLRVNLSGTTTGVLQFSLLEAASITSDGTVGGVFPLTGNQMSIQNGATAVGTVTFELKQLYGAVQTLNPDGTNVQELAKFTIAQANSKEAVSLSKITFYNNGNAADGDVKDLELVDPTGKVLATASQFTGKLATFDLSVSPYVLDKGITKDLTVRGKIVNGASRHIQVVVYNDYDVEVKGTTTGSFILPTTTSGGTAGSGLTFPVGNKTNVNDVLIGSGSVSFNKDALSPSTAAVPGSTSVVLAQFAVKPNGEDMELRKITLAVREGGSTALSGTLYVKVDGAVVYSATASDISTSTTTPTSITLSTYPILKAAVSSKITVETNISSSAVTGTDTYQVYLDLTEAKRLITNDIWDPTVSQTPANIIAINGAKLAVTTLAQPVAQSVVPGTNQFTFAKFELNAGASGEDVRVSSLIVSSTMSGTGAATTDIANMVMYGADGKPLTTSNSTVVNGATITFTFTNPILVARTVPVTLTLKGDVIAKSASNTETVTYNISADASITATGKETGNSVTNANLDEYGSGQAMTIASSGTLTLSLVSGAGASPSQDQLVTIGTQNLSVFAFKLTALNEAQKITTLKLTASGTAISSNDVLNLKLYRGSETTPFATGSQMTCATAIACTFTWTATDNLLPEAIQPGSSVTIYVKADVGGQGQAKLGEDFKFKIASSTADVVAKGAYSGSASTVSGAPVASGATYIVPFSVVVAPEIPAVGSSQTVAVLASTPVAVFKVTNNGNAQITVTQFKVTSNKAHTSTSTTLDLQYSDESKSIYSAHTASSSAATAGTAGETITFGSFATPITINGGGAYRYFAVAIGALGGSVSGDTYSFAIASLGDVKYSVTEANLGYEGNADNNAQADTISNLKTDGLPNLGTYVKQ